MAFRLCLLLKAKKMQTVSIQLREKWLLALLPHIPFEGWTRQSLNRAADEAGLSAGEQALAAPRGVPDLIRAFFDRAEAQAAREISAVELSEYRVHERVALGVKIWLDALQPHKEAARRAAQRGFLPWGSYAALERTYHVSDMIWTAIGDTSTDYNQYTKRALLASTVPLIFLHWLDQEDEEKLMAYIHKRLKIAMRFGQMGSKILSPALNRLKKNSADG